MELKEDKFLDICKYYANDMKPELKKASIERIKEITQALYWLEEERKCIDYLMGEKRIFYRR